MIDRTSEGSQLVYKSSGTDNNSTQVYIGGTDLLSGVSYFITNRFNGLSLDVPAGSAEEGTNLQQWNLTGGKHQEWRITATENGYCKITSMIDESICLAVGGTTADDGLDIQIQKYTGADNQQWKLIEKRGSYGIVSKSSGDKSGVDVYGWSEENGGAIKQWNYWGGDCQLWNITPVNPVVNDGGYSIKNVNSGLWVGLSDTDSAMQTDVLTPWNIKKLDDGTYSIQDAEGNALTVQDGSGEDGKDIYLSEYTGNDSQKFRIYANADGSYAVLSAVSGSLSGFDVFGISLDAGANICQWNYWGGNGQKFILEPAALPETAHPETPGDLNFDGRINIFDLVIAKTEIMKYMNMNTIVDYSNKAQDWNADGDFTIADLVGLQKFIAGKE
jgi:arabinan endo-1,5-alpha-L-arabinosidase